MGISRFKVIPVIFPRKDFKMEKIDGRSVQLQPCHPAMNCGASLLAKHFASYT